MNIQLLKKLSNEMDNGKVLWSLFWANEYFEANHPIRLALVTKADTLFTDKYSDFAKLIEKANAGETLSTISKKEREELLELEQTNAFRKKTRNRTLPTPRTRDNVLRRTTQRREEVKSTLTRRYNTNSLRLAV